MRLAVVGCGVMGANHARVAHAQPTLELTAVVDGDGDRTRKLHDSTGAAPFATVEELLTARARNDVQIDGAVVAVPTAGHVHVAEALLDAGVHVLIEKPLAGSVEDAARLARRARASGCTVMVGHIERFNSVVAETIRQSVDPIEIETARIGPFAARVADSVVLDLMIHDLDIVRQLAKSSVSRIQAVAQRRRTDTEDLAVALLEFENGTTATLKASRLGQQKIRTLVVTLAESVITADLIRQDIAVHRLQHVEFLSETGTRYRQSGVVEIPFIENRGEPLAAELLEFASAVAAGRDPVVTVEDGYEAVVMAHGVLDALRR